MAEQIRHTIEIEAACRNENAEKPRNSSQLKRQIAWQAAQRRAGAVLGKMFPFGQAGHLARLYGYDPRAAIREARCPGLYVFAGLDSMVPAEPNLERFAKIWQSNPPANLSTAVIPDTDHHFHITDTICFDREESRRKPFSPVLVEVLQEWLAAHNL